MVDVDWCVAGMSYPLESEVRFRKPVVLPSTATLKVRRTSHVTGLAG